MVYLATNSYTLGICMSTKLNWLIHNTSAGSVVTQSWMSKNGISPTLAQKYTQSNWLTKLKSGVYFIPGQQPEWQDAVYCLVKQLNMPIHLAGLSSLTHQGKSHYLKLNNETVWLNVQGKPTIPRWFKAFPQITDDKHQWNLLTTSKLKVTENDIIALNIKGITLPASCPELAAYEALEAMPKQISFEHAAELFQGLTNLSPRKVESLLIRSSSVRSNRLYLFLAHYYNHPWVKRLNESAINLGSGKRQIIEGGKLDKRYNITVPEKYSSSN